LIALSVQIFIVTSEYCSRSGEEDGTHKSRLVVFLGTLMSRLTVCEYNAAGQLTAGQAGCYNLVPVFVWIRFSIISIFLVFMISYLPLFIQGKPRHFIAV
jgi:hypothetical protein